MLQSARQIALRGLRRQRRQQGLLVLEKNCENTAKKFLAGNLDKNLCDVDSGNISETIAAQGSPAINESQKVIECCNKCNPEEVRPL